MTTETDTTDEEHEATRRTGRRLADSVATVRVDETPADNPRVAIHVEHVAHDGGTRCFWRRRDSDVTRSIRSHLSKLARNRDAEVARVEVIDEAGVGIRESDLLPHRLSRSRPGSPAVEVEVTA